MRNIIGDRRGLAALALFAFTAAWTLAGSAGAAPFARSEVCREYGYVPGTRAFAECRVNVRRYWSTGPCAQPAFASVHLRYCHVVPEIDF
jgi:hypothetical protein